MHCMPLLRTVHQGQTDIKKGPIADVNSAVMDLVAFKAKAKISIALHHVLKDESALCSMKCTSDGLSKKLKQSQAVPQGGVAGQAPVLAHDSTGSMSPNLLLRLWIWSHISRVNLPNKDMYYLREEVPVVGHLILMLQGRSDPS